MNTKTTRPHIRRGGFTILELLIVIAIILAIGGIVAVNVIGMSEQSDTGITRVKIQNFEQALDVFKLHMKRYPTEEEGGRGALGLRVA